MRGKTAEDLQLLELLDPVAEAAGYDIVRLRLMGGDHARRLQIMAERPADGDMNVEDCARAVPRASPRCWTPPTRSPANICWRSRSPASTGR